MLDPELLELSDDGTQAELRIIPNVHGPITRADIDSLLAFPDFTEFFPLSAQIDKAMAQVNSLCGQDDGKFEQFYNLAERKDGHLNIEISQDKMQAIAQITAAWGGKQITLTATLNAFKSHSISMGLSKVKIDALLKQVSGLRPGETCKGVIAQGKAPVNGLNAILDRKVPLARERLLQPQEREDGSVDMRNLGAVIMVKPGDVLMVKTPSTPGTEGYTVTGEALPPKPGRDLELVAGSGTALSEADPNILVAAVAGQPVMTPKGMQVDDVLQIKNVDVGYGHVNFKGCVLVTGDVQEGMVVKSSGDITVMGFVDSATLEADGDVIISKGVLGRLIKDQELSTKISAKGQIAAQFVQYSSLQAQGDILVTKQLLHSHTITKGRLTVSNPTGRRGDLVGGRVDADKGITAVAIGATAGTKTEIFCAMNQGELKQELKQQVELVKAKRVAEQDTMARIKKLPPKSQWQGDIVMVEQVRMMLDEKRQATDNKLKEEAEYERLKAEVDGYYQHFQIEALNHVFVNVELHLGPAYNRTQREHGPCTISNTNNEICFDYGNKPRSNPR
jgi:uncharacterized protein